jgi:hypothetical protein
MAAVAPFALSANSDSDELFDHLFFFYDINDGKIGAFILVSGCAKCWAQSSGW